MKDEELQAFAKLIELLGENELKYLIFVLSSSLHYRIPVHLVVKELEGMKEDSLSKKVSLSPPIDSVIKTFFYGIGWHNRSYQKLTEQAIELLCKKLLRTKKKAIFTNQVTAISGLEMEI